MSEIKALRENWPIIAAVVIGAVGWGTLRADVTALAADKPKTAELQIAVNEIRIEQGRVGEQIKALQRQQTAFQEQNMEGLRKQEKILAQILAKLLAQ